MSSVAKRNVNLFDIKTKYHKQNVKTGKEIKPNPPLDVKKDLEGMMNEIHRMNMTSLLGEKRRSYIRERVKSLGGKIPKRKCIPYPEYMVQQKSAKQEEARQKEENRILGLGLQMKSKKRVVRGKGRWKEGKVKFTPNVGRLKGGVLKVSSQDINTVTKNRH